jgi:hypothetical protein
LQNASDCRDARLAAQLSCSRPNIHVVSHFKFEGKSLMNRRPENMFDLVRDGDGMKVCSRRCWRRERRWLHERL